MDIFGVTVDQELAHQASFGDSWYPSDTKWEKLGSGTKSDCQDATSSSETEL